MVDRLPDVSLMPSAGCALAGMLALLPGRFLGNLLWKYTLGVIA